MWSNEKLYDNCLLFGKMLVNVEKSASAEPTMWFAKKLGK